MKKFPLLMLLGFVFSHPYAQHNNFLGVDCNPRLNEQEIRYLSYKFAADNYDFTDKTIGFAAHNVKRICRVSTIAPLSMRLPINKKEYFMALAQDSCQTTISKLFVLNEDEKKQSGGFDAFVVLVPKKKENKVGDKTRSRLAEVFGYRRLNYPGNLHLVGNDARDELTDDDAVLFNSIYEQEKGKFDFKGKKIAFVNPHEQEKQQKIKTKVEYINKIKKHLEKDFLYPTDHLEIFNEEEKKESGGYDAMIVYFSKKYGKGDFIQILKENNTR